MDSGRTTKQETKEVYPPGSLEATSGYTIKKAPNGGGFLLYKIGEKDLEPIDIVKETKTWYDETAKKNNLNADLLRFSLVKAKATPKKKATETSKVSTTTFEILTNKVNRINPDSGVVNEKAYLGVWLPAKVQTEEGVKVQQIFHLLFNDGELIPADSETLSSKDIYLQSDPIFTTLKLSIDTILNLAELPPIDPTELIYEIMEQAKRYVEFDDPRYYALVTYWIIATYLHKQFEAFPYLFINAIKRSGKTKLLDLLKQLAYNAIFSPNMSTSALFRLTQSAGATTLLDETEDLLDPEKKAEFKSLLLSGYKRGSPVYRSEKQENDKYVPVPFDVYSPKAIANINGLGDVLEDRCITITMKRGRNLEIINKDVPLEDPIWETIRDKLARLYFQEFAAITATYNQFDKIDKVLENISVGCEGSVVSVASKRVQEKKHLYVARTWQLWRPLFSVATYIHIISSTRIKPTQTTQPTQPTLNPFNDLLNLSVDLITEKDAESATDSGESLLLMGLLRKITKDDYYKPSDLIEAAKEFVETMPNWFNATWLGRVFKRLGFKDKRRIGRGVEYRLTPIQVQDMADRLNVHLPDEMLRETWFVDMDRFYEKWLDTIEKIEECHKRHNGIGWTEEISEEPKTELENAEGESETDNANYGKKPILKVRKLRPTPGVLCQAEGKGQPCIKEAEHDFNGNLYCPEHYEISRKDCVENGYDIEEAP